MHDWQTQLVFELRLSCAELLVVLVLGGGVGAVGDVGDELLRGVAQRAGQVGVALDELGDPPGGQAGPVGPHQQLAVAVRAGADAEASGSTAPW